MTIGFGIQGLGGQGDLVSRFIVGIAGVIISQYGINLHTKSPCPSN